jgi:hypothetical protein
MTMSNEKKPLLSDKFLDELAEEINALYGAPIEEQDDVTKANDDDNVVF